MGREEKKSSSSSSSPGGDGVAEEKKKQSNDNRKNASEHKKVNKFKMIARRVKTKAMAKTPKGEGERNAAAHHPNNVQNSATSEEVEVLRRALQNLRIKNMHDMVETVFTESEGRRHQMKLLRLTNSQAQNFNPANILEVLDAMRLREHKLVSFFCHTF